MSVTQRIARLALVGVIASVAVVTGPPNRATATHPGNNGRIALACADGLWTLDADGTDWQQVVDTEVIDPAWSPGGRYFAFSRREAEDTVSLFTMRADGTKLKRLTYTPSTDVDAEWSPDGFEIAFTSDKQIYAPEPSNHVWVYRGQHSSSRSAWSSDPSWSPDGTTLAYVLDDPYGRQGIWFNRLDWYDPWTVIVPPTAARDEAPDWHPGGSRYLFVRVQAGVRSVWAADADGSDLDRLTDVTLDVRSPHYSPDGSTIAFLGRPAEDAGTDAPYGFWTMSASGASPAEVAGDLDCRSLTWQPIPDFPLVDARFSPFETEIQWAYEVGITAGCTLEHFCARGGVSREQMASFLARALDLPAATKDYFTDDEESIHEENINRIAEAGITTGCSSGAFCPKEWMTREQMASFLARALDLPAAETDHFTDDESSIHEADINRLADAGITTGCDSGRYCPYYFVLREQMVAFLYRSLPH